MIEPDSPAHADVPLYFRYWGKTAAKGDAGAPYHLLAYHCLDVAACGRALLRLERFSLAPLARELGWASEDVEKLFLALLALHDCGKFARSFQNLAPNLSPELVPPVLQQRYCRERRHDTLGWILMRSLPEYEEVRWDYAGTLLEILYRVTMGHHGRPPGEEDEGSQPQRWERDFLLEDRTAGGEFKEAIYTLFDVPPLSPECGPALDIVRRHSWRLAGLAVLADWLGSDRRIFPYDSKPRGLAEYWRDVAQAGAERALSRSGLMDCAARSWTTAKALLPKLDRLTPLQSYAADVTIAKEPQMFLLEDVTGSGKTEAALLLCHRLMSAGRANGVYFALPTMATANQMYGRVGEVYRRLFAESAEPSIVLAHSARDLMDGFRESILPVGTERGGPEPDYASGEPTASAQCAAWLADSRKKTMLADVGVGTIDQALQAILPERHQSLRLLGLAGKVLVLDEVHAYEVYTEALLLALIEAHAQAGGSLILLSATVPAALRARMVQRFQQGLGMRAGPAAEPDLRYPLVTHLVGGTRIETQACATRSEVVRSVNVAFLEEEAFAVERVLQLAEAGRCVCWVRNTVHDARQAYVLLSERLTQDRLTLFHARYAMRDRLAIERGVLARFDEGSTADARRGQVLIATQVVEQSLDLDFDEMIVDLAPVDLIIQRAGRLRRHTRAAGGDRSVDGAEHRGPATLHVLAPVWAEHPAADWYKAVFPIAAYVYEEVEALWRTMGVLRDAGCIVSPGAVGEPGSVRQLVEAVYGEERRELPEAFEGFARKREGEALGRISLAKFNVLELADGYSQKAGQWDHPKPTPTRLGEDRVAIYLACEGTSGLEPILPSGPHAWEMSAVNYGRVGMTLSPDWQARFALALQKLRRSVPMLADEMKFVLPLVQVGKGEAWTGECVVEGVVQVAYYDSRTGFTLTISPASAGNAARIQRVCCENIGPAPKSGT